MPLVLTRSQQVRTGAVYPKSAYTRVVGFLLDVPADDLWHHANTHVLGQRVWLLRVKIRHIPRAVNPANYTSFEIKTGKMQALTHADIDAWEFVIPFMAEGGPRGTMRLYDGSTEYVEAMSKLYVGEARRFGINVRRAGAGVDLFQVTFLIAEG